MSGPDLRLGNHLQLVGILISNEFFGISLGPALGDFKPAPPP
jgi:hypothetical protein